ncbi:TetR/AcrR family transcriptional regulator [Frondihabitans cladoniiphilus]|uniref:HTH tetR-type domain-containing protein n=1 Tax=Frondihabitans cladoniiphilus TaxID=715785 RepID=A0ABP8W9L3_9MICO
MPRDLGQHAGLTRESVLDAARIIASEQGLGNLTMRSLAKRLEVAPNALYGWVASKTALLDALVDDALKDVGVSPLSTTDDSDQRGRLTKLLLDTFDAIMERPELATLFLDRAASPGPNATRIRVKVRQLLIDNGVAAAGTDAAVPILLVHVIGFAAFVLQTHGAKLLDEPHLGPARNLVATSISWLLNGVTKTPATA